MGAYYTKNRNGGFFGTVHLYVPGFGLAQRSAPVTYCARLFADVQHVYFAREGTMNPFRQFGTPGIYTRRAGRCHQRCIKTSWLTIGKWRKTYNAIVSAVKTSRFCTTAH
jgi:hypothetical protein